MYDTIVCFKTLEYPLDHSLFDGANTYVDDRGTVSRMWTVAGDEYEPRANYYESLMGQRLELQFSVEKMRDVESGIHWTNVNEVDKDIALDGVNEWLADTFVLYEDVRNWIVTRVDYAYNFQVSDVALYLQFISTLNCRSMHRAVFETGVVWKSKSRWVKFYDKGQEMGLKNQNILRFEVSNLKDGTKYMCKSWFKCDRVVGEVLHPGRALYVLSLYLHYLNLDRDEYESDALTEQRLRDVFNSSSLSALGALKLIQEHGTEAIKLKLMSSSSYHEWNKKLSSQGFFSSSTLDKLDMNVLSVLQSLISSKEAQNLEALEAGLRMWSPKIMWKILARKLSIAENCQMVPELVEKLRIVYESH